MGVPLAQMLRRTSCLLTEMPGDGTHCNAFQNAHYLQIVERNRVELHYAGPHSWVRDTVVLPTTCLELGKSLGKGGCGVVRVYPFAKLLYTCPCTLSNEAVVCTLHEQLHSCSACRLPRGW